MAESNIVKLAKLAFNAARARRERFWRFVRFLKQICVFTADLGSIIDSVRVTRRVRLGCFCGRRYIFIYIYISLWLTIVCNLLPIILMKTWWRWRGQKRKTYFNVGIVRPILTSCFEKSMNCCLPFFSFSWKQDVRMGLRTILEFRWVLGKAIWGASPSCAHFWIHPYEHLLMLTAFAMNPAAFDHQGINARRDELTSWLPPLRYSHTPGEGDWTVF